MSDLTTVRPQLKTQASGVTGGGYTMNAARILLGYDDIPPSTELIQSFAGTGSSSTGPYMIICAGSFDFDSTSQKASLRIPVLLYLGITQTADNTFVNVETFVAAIKNAWSGKDQSWKPRPIDARKVPAVVCYECQVRTLGC